MARDISRRNFLKTSTGAIGASTLGTSSVFANRTSKTRNKDKPDVEKAKIYTVFLGTNPSKNDTDILPRSNEDILKKIKSKCPGIEFVVRDVTKSIRLEFVINELRDLRKQKFDGVLIIGTPTNYALTETGLPTIVVYSIHDFMNIPYALYQEQGKVLTATLDRWNVCASAEISSAMYKDLIQKINLFKALKDMKKSHILSVNDREYVNPYYGDRRKSYPHGYNEILLNAIDESFGVQVTKIGTNEVADEKQIQDLWYQDSREAEKIAQMWIREARKMINTIESEVVRAAKVYLALRILMKKFGSNVIAFHIRSLIKNPKPEDKIWPSLANTELQKQGIVGCCQSHLNVVLTHMLAQYAFGRPSMMGDFMVDTFNNTTYLMHCGAPINPWGGNGRISYEITDHRERTVREHSKAGCGACLRVFYPPDEPVTFWRIDVLSKQIFVHTGTTIARAEYYKDHFDETMCRTKLSAKVSDAKKIQNFTYPEKYGVHKSGTLGDFRERIKDLGNLIGYKVIEVDKTDYSLVL